MKKRNSRSLTRQQRTELKALKALPDREIDTSDIPEILDWSGARRGALYRPVTQQITLRLDADVVAWFKANVQGGRGYQTEINRVLREHVKASRMLEGGFATMTESSTNQLWSDSACERLAAARALSEPALSEVRTRLRAGLPTADWPYGFATSINPLLVTLGVSPGSVRTWKGRDPAKDPFAAPTAGQPHPHLTVMRRATPFGKRIRHLARSILREADLPDDDAYALFGNLVLDPGRSGAARDVRIDPEFARWVLQSIRDHLRPRHLVCIGMKGHRDAARLLEQTFDGFVRARPHREHRFHSYRRSDLTFQEWDVDGPHGNKTTIVFWPQHPSRVPFNRFDIWQAACSEYAERHGAWIRP